MQEAGAEGDEVGGIAEVLGEDDAAARPEAAAGFAEPRGPLVFRAEFVDREQAEHDIDAAGLHRPAVERSGEGAGSGRVELARPLDRRLGHPGGVEMIERRPRGGLEPCLEILRNLIETGVAEDAAIFRRITERPVEPAEAVEIGAVVDEVCDPERDEQEVARAGKGRGAGELEGKRI